MALKAVIKSLCDVIGVNEFLVRRQRSDLLVLCYHGVVAEPRADRWSYENWVGAEEFRQQLRWLRKYFEPVNIAGLAAWHSGDWKSHKGPVLITFDDGYRNNRTIAAPILQQERVPAVFFLATGYIGTARTLWNDEVRVRVLNWPGAEISLPSGESVPMPSELGLRRALADRATQESKRLAEAPCSAWLERLREGTPSLDTMDDPEARAFMNWTEARELAEMGFDLGSHTIEHPILSMIGRERMAEELRDSMATVERELKRPCAAIAYPNGTERDVSEALIEEVRAAGYQWAFMTTPLWQKPAGEVLRIARVGFPGHTDLATFKLYVSGLHRRLSHRGT